MKITIIGSFRKYYEQICSLIDVFHKNGIEVLSPQKSYICNEVDGFVILNSDCNGEPVIIQEHVFTNIRNSDCVYVWNPLGYLGNSTCYEIGKIIEMKKTIFFKEKPIDLPIQTDASMIMDANELVNYLTKDDIGGCNE